MAADATLVIDGDLRPLNRKVQAAFKQADRLFASSNISNPRMNARGIEEPLGRITGAAKEFESSMAASNARVIAFGASVGIIMGVQRAFRALVSDIVEVEKALADINVILNASNEQLKEFGSELFAIAQNTGQSFAIVAEAATELARQGLGAEETLKRVNDAMILVRLSGMQAAGATEALTAIINSFNKANLDSTEIINKLANVDAAFATSVDGLAEAIKRVGSTAQDANVSLDETIALVASLQQTTARGENIIGNALKTIFTRLGRSTTIEQLKELGVQINQSQTGIERLQALSKALETAEEGVGNKIKELAGGVFQINVVSAALGDLSKEQSFYNQALETSLSTTDEAIRRNERLNQTIDAMANQSMVGITEFFTAIGDAGAADTIKEVLNMFNYLMERIQGAEPIVAAFVDLFKPLAPGFNMVLLIVGKLVGQLIMFGKEAFSAFFGVNKVLTEQEKTQQRITGAVATTTTEFRKQLNAAKSIAEQEKIILKILREQAVASKVRGGALAGVTSLNKINRVQNFANDDIGNAYRREVKALTGRGLSQKEAKELIFVGYDPRVGIGVGNYMDEPSGTLAEGVNARLKSGRGIGGPSNFAQPIVGGLRGADGKFIKTGPINELLTKLQKASLGDDNRLVDQYRNQLDEIKGGLEPSSQKKLQQAIRAPTRINSHVTNKSGAVHPMIAQGRAVSNVPKAPGNLRGIVNLPQEKIQKIKERQAVGRFAHEQRISGIQTKLDQGNILSNRDQKALVADLEAGLRRDTRKAFGKGKFNQVDPKVRKIIYEKIQNYERTLAQANEQAFDNILNKAPQGLPTRIGLFSTGRKEQKQIESSFLALGKGQNLSKDQREHLKLRGQDYKNQLLAQRRGRLQTAGFAASIVPGMLSSFVPESENMGVSAVGGGLRGAAAGGSLALINPMLGLGGAVVGGGIGATMSAIESLGTSVEALGEKLSDLRGKFTDNINAAQGYSNAQAQINTLMETGAGSSREFQNLNDELINLITSVDDDKLKAGLLGAGDNLERIGEVIGEYQKQQQLIMGQTQALQSAAAIKDENQNLWLGRGGNEISGRQSMDLASVLASGVDFRELDLDEFKDSIEDTEKAFEMINQNLDDFSKALNLSKESQMGLLNDVANVIETQQSLLKNVGGRTGRYDTSAAVSRIMEQRTTDSQRRRELNAIRSSNLSSSNLTRQDYSARIFDGARAQDAELRSQLAGSSSQFRGEERDVANAIAIEIEKRLETIDASERGAFLDTLQGVTGFDDLSAAISDLSGLDQSGLLTDNLFTAKKNLDFEREVLAERQRAAQESIRLNHEFGLAVEKFRQVEASFGDIFAGGDPSNVFNASMRGDRLETGKSLSALEELFPFIEARSSELFKNIRREQQQVLLKDFQADAAQDVFTNNGRSDGLQEGMPVIRAFRQGDFSEDMIVNFPPETQEALKAIAGVGEEISRLLDTNEENFEKAMAGDMAQLLSLAKSDGIITVDKNAKDAHDQKLEREIISLQETMKGHQEAADMYGAEAENARGVLRSAKVTEKDFTPLENAISLFGDPRTVYKAQAEHPMGLFGFKREDMGRRDLLDRSVGDRLNSFNFKDEGEARSIIAKTVYDVINDRGDNDSLEDVLYEIRTALEDNNKFNEATGRMGGSSITDLVNEIFTSMPEFPDLEAQIETAERSQKEQQELANVHGQLLQQYEKEAKLKEINERSQREQQKLAEVHNELFQQYDKEVRTRATNESVTQDNIDAINESTRAFEEQRKASDEQARATRAARDAQIEAGLATMSFGENVRESSEKIINFIEELNRGTYDSEKRHEDSFGRQYSFSNNQGTRLTLERDRLNLMKRVYTEEGQSGTLKRIGKDEEIRIDGESIREAERRVADLDAGFSSFLGGFRSEVFRTQEEMMNLASVGAQVGQSLESSLGNAFGDFVTGAKTAKEAFKDFVGGLLQEVARILAQKAAAQLIGMLFSSFSFGGATDGASATGDLGSDGGLGVYDSYFKAGGHIPNVATGLESAMISESAAISRGVGGARKTARPVMVEGNFAAGLSRVVANTDEYMVGNYRGSGRDAIFNQQMVRQAGGLNNVAKMGNVTPISPDGSTPEGGGGGVTVNINTSISEGGASSSESRQGGGDRDQGIKEFSRIMAQVARRTIMEERRPGGSLSR